MTEQAEQADGYSEVVRDGHKISVTFERKISDGDYGSVTASAWVQNEVPEDADASTVAFKLGTLLSIAAVAVFDQLGLSYHHDEDTGVIREDLRPVTQGRVEEAFKSQASPAQSSGGIVVKNDDTRSPEPLPQWLIDQCTELGITQVFDNRLTKTGNQPWFKEAIPRGGTGHGKDGAAKGFWPAR